MLDYIELDANQVIDNLLPSLLIGHTYYIKDSTTNEYKEYVLVPKKKEYVGLTYDKNKVEDILIKSLKKKQKQFKLTFTANKDTTVPVYYTKESFIAKKPDETISLTANEQKTTVIDKPEIYRFGVVDYDPSTGKRISSNTNIIRAKIEGTILDGYRLFDRVTSITECDVSKMDTSKMISTYGMFNLDTALTNLDVSNFDTSNVTTMRIMFQVCCNIDELDVSHFNTSNVTDMSYMFMASTTQGYPPMKFTELDLSGWDTSKVTNMECMFQCCENLTSLDLSKWDTSNVTNMHHMFGWCSSLITLDLSNFDTSNVTTIAGMFNESSNITTVKVTNCSPDTQNKILSQLKLDISNYDWVLENGVITRS